MLYRKILLPIVLSISALLACTLTPVATQEPLDVRLGTHLSQAFEAEAASRALWDRVLMGELVPCTEQLESPPLFELSTAEQQQAPLSVPVQAHMNEALLAIHHANQLWRQECQHPRQVVPIATIREAQESLNNAQQALRKAAQAWYEWQPSP